MLAFIQQEREIELAYRMTQQLLHLMKHKQGETATAWISICSSCGVSELEAFALGLQKEFPAFQAACSLPYNNGMTEGFVNKLKHIKGSMYGRGSFELLRQTSPSTCGIVEHDKCGRTENLNIKVRTNKERLAGHDLWQIDQATADVILHVADPGYKNCSSALLPAETLQACDKTCVRLQRA